MTLRSRVWLIVVFGLLWAFPGASSAQVRRWPSERPPKPLEARAFAFPRYEARTMPNGLQVVVVEHHEQPAVSVQLLVRAGSAYDPPGKGGVANMVAALLDQGTARRSARDIADEIDTIGGDLSIAAGSDVIFARATVMKDSLGVALDLLSDVCRAPAFAADELTRQLQQLRSGLQVRYDDPDYVASVVFERLVYGLHPYGLPASGTPQSIERITRDDLIGFHQRHFAPNNSLLAVVGDVTPGEAFAAVEAALGGWERKEIPSAPDAGLTEPARRVVVVHKPDAVQTEIRVGHTAIPRAHRDYLPLDMAIRVLGGEGVNRLQQVLRMSRGLTYGASADLLAYQVAGDITAETDTQSMTTGEAVRLVVDEFSRLKREGVDERELNAVKDYLVGSYPLSIETPDGIATKVLNALFFGLPLEELQDYRERARAVTPDDIRRVIDAHVRPDRLTVVLVGAGAFSNQLRGVGLRDIEVIPIDQLDLAAANLRAEKPALAPRRGGASPAPAPAVTPAPIAPPAPIVPTVPAEPAQGGDAQAGDRVAAESILQRAVEAAGGIEQLRQVKTVRATSATIMHTPEGPLQTRTTTWMEYPGRVRIEAETSSGLVVQVYDAGHAWIQDSHGPRDAPDAMRRAFAASAERDWIALLLAAAQKQLVARVLPEWRGVGGRLLLGVELTGAQLPATKLYVDAGSAQLARIVYDTPGPRGNETSAETFSDFRVVDGVSVPFKAVVQRGSSPLLERTLTGIVFNEPLPPGLFTKPGAGKPPR